MIVDIGLVARVRIRDHRGVRAAGRRGVRACGGGRAFGRGRRSRCVCQDSSQPKRGHSDANGRSLQRALVPLLASLLVANGVAAQLRPPLLKADLTLM